MPSAVAEKTGSPHQSLQEQVLWRASEFTMIPAAAMKAIEIGRNPACSVNDYSTAIESDVRLAADILSMANSTLYSTGTPAATLRAAVMRLGLRKCQNLILATCTAGLMRSLPGDDTDRRERLWRHGFLTGVIGRRLNDQLSLGFQGEEFTAGLMHDLGRSLLAATAPEEFAAADPLDFQEDWGVLEREREVLGTDHCQLGTVFAARSGLPENLLAAIEHHHAPASAGPHRLLVATVAVADHMANHIEAFGPDEPYDPASNPFAASLSNDERAVQALAGVAPGVAAEAYAEAARMISS